ncbi:MAG: efflux RND transporter permease subunit [Thermodesulfobacteriota bacterium]
MAAFFIRRPIVAIVIAIITVIVGIVSALGLPVSQYPEIVPPEVNVTTTYYGADALTVEQSVATPIEQQMNGVDNMNYMYSLNTNSGALKLVVNFDVKTDPNTNTMLAQMLEGQAESQLPAGTREVGVTVAKSTSAPIMVVSLYSPNGTYDDTFLSNYAYIVLNDQLKRLPGVASVTVFGAGQYAMRLWVEPDRLAKLKITVSDIIAAVQAQNTVNPAGRIGDEPAPPGTEFSFAIRAQGRLETAEEFGQIVLRANKDGSVVRLSEVADIELGTQTYGVRGRLDGKPAAVLAIYQLPGTNAIEAVDAVNKALDKAAASFPPDMAYVVSLDTTEAVREGFREIVIALGQALLLVMIVVFIFLQGWRPTLIPALAVPVSLIGTFALFPVLGFSINTIALLGLVLAIGLVVDDAIVVVEAVESQMERGFAPKEAALRAMKEVSGPVVAIALVLSAVFLPTVFIPGITGKLYQQFAVTIAVSVMISAFNALSLSPAMAALILKPRKRVRGPLGMFYRGFNRGVSGATSGYVAICRGFLRKAFLSMLLLAAVSGVSLWLGDRLPGGFLPNEDQGYVYTVLQLPKAASLQRTDEAAKKAEEIIQGIPGVAHVTTITGLNMLAGGITNTYNGFFFITLKNWHERTAPGQSATGIIASLNKKLASLPQGISIAYGPPAIRGIGSAGGVTFILEDRAGRDVKYLADNTDKFLDAVRKRPEIAKAFTTFVPDVPQVFVKVDRDKVLKQGVDIREVYRTLQVFMGGALVNYFNRFGRQWQVFVEAKGKYRTRPDQLGQFFVRNEEGNAVPLSSFSSIENRSGPEYTMRFNLYRAVQINAVAAPGVSSAQAMKAMEEVFHEIMPAEMGFDYMGMSFQEQKAQEGIPAWVVFALSLLFVFLILAAQYESWSLPFAVLLCTPVAVLGAFTALFLLHMEFDIYAQISLVMLIGLAAKNAILIVEFAKNAAEKQGKSAVEAALEGARLRIRPILMTSFAFILGCVPLALASGSGALARKVMGSAVIGGMLAATVIAVFLIPVAFYVVQRIAREQKGTASNELPHEP